MLLPQFLDQEVESLCLVLESMSTQTPIDAHIRISRAPSPHQNSQHDTRTDTLYYRCCVPAGRRRWAAGIVDLLARREQSRMRVSRYTRRVALALVCCVALSVCPSICEAAEIDGMREADADSQAERARMIEEQERAKGVVTLVRNWFTNLIL